ncbi:unnamed protein product [Schistosoma turkestanicum]|nr:unnamed protein product [Schistosoma turkestanicum]
MSAKNFSSKEKLFKILKEFQARFNSPFRLSEATKWCESYFAREGGNVETVGVFLEFILSLGFLCQVDQNIFFSRYYFNVERIEEFFSTFCGSINERSMKGKIRIKNSDESGIRSLENSQDDISFESLEFESNCCCKSVLTNKKSHLWFEEIIRRLSCLMETNRDELISIMKSTVPPLPQDLNDFSINMGTAAYTNSIVLENWHNCLKNSTGELVDPVAITCLDELSKWPNNIDHQSEVCEKKHSPNSFLSVAISHLKILQHCYIPKTVELLLDYIFRSCPDVKLLAIMNSLLKGWINSVSNNANELKLLEKTHSPNVINSHVNDKNSFQNVLLPPSTTPLKDTNNLNKKVYRHSISKAVAPDDNSFTEYHPISPIVHCRRFHVRTSDPCQKYENLSSMLLQTGKTRRLSGSESFYHESYRINKYITTNYQGDSGKSNDERNLPTTSYTQHSNLGSYCLSDQIPNDPISSIQHHWPIMETYDLALACQLVLLFLPPLMFSRLKMMVDLLRGVLSNHEHLASWFVNYGSYENIENKSASILASDVPSSLEITLHTIVKHFGPLLLRVSSDSANENAVNRTNSRICWRECLLCLLLCDSENFLLTLPNSLQYYLQSVNNNNSMTSNNLKTEKTILHLEELIGLVGFESQGSRKPRLAHSSSSSSECVSSPACIPSTRSVSNFGLDCRMLKLINSRDNPIEFASTPTKNGRSSSLQNSPRSTDTLNCHLMFDKNNLGIGNLSIKSHSTFFISEESSDRFGRSENWSVENSLTGSNSSIFLQSDLDPKRLAALGNTAHLIKLLNQILNDRDMNPRRKMKCLQDFRKSHPDVFWLRFRNEEKAANYLSRLQRRIDSQNPPSVFERFTNALRRRLQSPVKQQD